MRVVASLFTRVSAALFVCVSLGGPPAMAHQCVLDGSSAAAIQSYNVCKADLANGTANHGSGGQAGELARLQAENEALKSQLAEIKRQLLGMLGTL